MAKDNPLWILGPLTIGALLVKVGLSGKEAHYTNKREIVLDQLLDKMCDLTDEFAGNVEEVIIRPEDSEDEAHWKEIVDLWEIENLLGETGCPICEKEDGTLFLGKCETPHTGAGCRIDYGSCEKEGAKHIGSFHTHPIGGTTPSLPDMQCSLNQEEKVFCVGGKVGDKAKVTCYTPRGLTSEKGLWYNPFKGYYPEFPDTPPEGKIRFYREEPPPLPSEIQTMLTDDDVLMHLWGEPSEEEKKEFIEYFRGKLAEGEYPQEYWDVYETRGEMDEIEVYLPEQLEKVEEKKLAFVSRNFSYDSEECKAEAR